MSLFGTTMTSFALVGSTGASWRVGVGVYGLLASSSAIGHSLCFFLVAVKLWSLGRRHGFRTQAEFFRQRLESEGVGLLLFTLLVVLVIPYVLTGVIGAGTTINGITRGEFKGQFFAAENGGVANWLASLVICIVVLIYVFFGGMRGTAWANTFQTIVFMTLGVVTFVVIANSLGGKDSFLANLQAATEQSKADHLDRAKISQTEFLSYMLIPLSVGMFPHVFQHWLTAKSASSFKLPVVAHPIFILIVWAPCVLIGVWASGSEAGVPANLDPNAVLAFLVKTRAGTVLGGFLTAGVLAAIMSSLDSQFLCLGTMFTNDVVLHYRRGKPLSDWQQVVLARGFIVAIVAIAWVLSLIDQPRIFPLGVWCFSGFTGLFPLIAAALYWKRLTAAGAYACVLATAASWGILFWQSGFAANPNYTLDISLGGEVYKTHPVAAITLCSMLAMVLVSLVTRPPSERTLAKFFRDAA
jgi:SSS family solute:Na+ symporter